MSFIKGSLTKEKMINEEDINLITLSDNKEFIKDEIIRIFKEV